MSSQTIYDIIASELSGNLVLQNELRKAVGDDKVLTLDELTTALAGIDPADRYNALAGVLNILDDPSLKVETFDVETGSNLNLVAMASSVYTGTKRRMISNESVETLSFIVENDPKLLNDIFSGNEEALKDAITKLSTMDGFNSTMLAEIGKMQEGLKLPDAAKEDLYGIAGLRDLGYELPKGASLPVFAVADEAFINKAIKDGNAQYLLNSPESMLNSDAYSISINNPELLKSIYNQDGSLKNNEIANLYSDNPDLVVALSDPKLGTVLNKIARNHSKDKLYNYEDIIDIARTENFFSKDNHEAFAAVLKFMGENINEPEKNDVAKATITLLGEMSDDLKNPTPGENLETIYSAFKFITQNGNRTPESLATYSDASCEIGVADAVSDWALTPAANKYISDLLIKNFENLGNSTEQAETMAMSTFNDLFIDVDDTSPACTTNFDQLDPKIQQKIR